MKIKSGNNMIISVIKTLRPKQWYKNTLIFAGIIFSKNLSNLSMHAKVIPAFIFFCALSGSVYTLNDIVDREKDCKHPVKCKRPIASGELRVQHAKLFFASLVFLSLSGCFYLNVQLGIAALFYFVLNFMYSFKFKNLIIVDILLISILFVIRAIAGTVVIDISLSPWLVICTFLLALFLALGKRRHEVVLFGAGAKEHRPVLEEYSIEMLEQMISITTATLIMAYSIYTFLAGNQYMMITIPFVIYGLFRYIYLVHKKKFGGETEMIFKDKPMVINLVLWTGIVICVVYDFLSVVVEWLGTL